MKYYDANYSKRCETNRKVGRKGGRPHKENPKETDGLFSKTQENPKETDGLFSKPKDKDKYKDKEKKLY